MTLDLDMNSLLKSLLKIIDVFCLILQYVCAKLTCNYVNDLWKPEIKNFQCLFVFSIRMYRFIFKILSEECTTFVEIFFKLYGSIIPLFFFTAAAKSLQSCPTLCDPIDGSPPGSPVPGSLQARTRVGCHFLLQCIKVKVKLLSPVRLFETPWTAVY